MNTTTTVINKCDNVEKEDSTTNQEVVDAKFVNVIKYDSVDNYELFHYVNSENIVRGYIQENGKMLTVSHVIEPPVVIDTTLEEYVNATFPDKLSNLTFTCGYESTAIRVWLRNGVVETSTHKRVRPTRSRWGNSIPFSQMYTALNGPTTALFTAEELEAGESKYTHFFLMVHPDILIATLDPNIGNGKLVYIGKIDITMPCTMSKPTPVDGYNDLVVSQDISLEEASKFVSEGFGPVSMANHRLCDGTVPTLPDDPRLESGEFVIMTEWTGVPWESDILRIHHYLSQSYVYRRAIRDNDPNLLHRVFTMSHRSTIDDVNEYIAQFPWISAVMPLDQTGKHNVAQSQWMATGTNNNLVDTANQTQRCYNIWNVILYCTPVCKKALVSSYFHLFHIERNRLAYWIRNMKLNFSNMLLPNYVRVKQIIEFATRRDGPHLLGQIQRVLKYEKGDSLYRLVSKMHEHTELMNAQYV